MFKSWERGPLREEAGTDGAGGDVVDTLPPVPPPDVTAMAAELAKQGDTINRLVGVVRSIPAQGVPPAPPAPSSSASDLEAEFWKNPVGVSQSIARAAAAEAAAAMVNNNPAADTMRETARTTVRGRDPATFDMLAVEIEAKVATMPPQFQQSATVWSNAFNIAVGENLPRVIELRKTTPPTNAGSGVSGALAPSPRTPDPPKEPKLTDDERDFVRRFGITEQGYRRGREAAAGQGSGKATEPSSWDDVMTFDSDVKRRRDRDRERAAAKGGK